METPPPGRLLLRVVRILRECILVVLLITKPFISDNCRGKNKFQCDKLGSQCYSEKEHCNGIGHCSNKRDEQSCSEYSRLKAFACEIVGLEDYVALTERKADLSTVFHSHERPLWTL